MSLLNVVRLDDIVRKDLQPRTTGHHRRGGLDEDEGVVSMEDGARKLDIALQHAAHTHVGHT